MKEERKLVIYLESINAWCSVIMVLCFFLAGVLILGKMLIDGYDSRQEIIQEPINNLKQYGLEVYDEEIKCWKACGEDKYFYSKGSVLSPDECECKITSNQQKNNGER